MKRPSAQFDEPSEFDDVVATSNKVLMRDAQQTDYLIIPLFAGVVAKLLLAHEAWDPSDRNVELREADLAVPRGVLALAEQARSGPSWLADPDAYGDVADLFFDQWASLLFLASASYERTTLGIGMAPSSRSKVTDTGVRWLAAQQPAPSLTESAIMATMLVSSLPRKPQEHPLLARSARRIRVTLADRLRREGLTTWPAVLAAAAADWNVDTLERLAFAHAKAGDAWVRFTMEAQEALIASKAEVDTAAPPAGPQLVVDTPEPDPDVQTAELLVADAVLEIDRSRAERDSVRRDRDRLADRHTRAQGRIESLESQLATAREDRARAEALLAVVQAERDALLDAVAADEAVAADAPALPADTFGGRRLLVFTGMESGSAREALGQAFVALGAASVDVYWAERMRGPETFPADALIVAEVSFMGHSVWETIVDRARRSGAWMYTAKHGAGMMARATGGAWLAHLRRVGEAGAPEAGSRG